MQLPPKEAFYSSLKSSGISDEDYAHARTVWDAFAAQKRGGRFTFGDYHDLYLLTDVLLLADVMHNFRTMCLAHYRLDPWRFHTVPGLTLKAGLRMTKASIDLIQDVDMHLFVEAGMRGGVSCVSKRLAEASDEPDEDGFRQFLLYLDANNLYGWAMSKPLPTGGFKWMSNLNNWRNRPCILEVDLDYPEELHSAHNDYPLAPESLKIEKVDKLIPNLMNKEMYILHRDNLLLYESLGLKIKKIHRGITFTESP